MMWLRAIRWKVGLGVGFAAIAGLWVAGCRAGDDRLPGPSATAAAVAAPVTGEAARPAVFLDTNYVAPTGRTIEVGIRDGARGLQDALDRAKPGDMIALEAGAVFTGNFTLPAKDGTGWVIVCSAAADGQLPPPSTRVTPSNAAAMPKVLSPNADAAIKSAPGAHHYRLIGLEVGVVQGAPTNYGILQFGAATRPWGSPEAMPHDLIIDRCYLHGNATGNARRGLALNSASTAVIDSYFANFHEVGADSQAIAGWNGPGPFKIVNNYLEGAGENVLFGGSDPSVANLVPSDIEFRRNHCFKPLSWKADDPSYAGTHWSVKNLFELKNARRVLVEGNIFENNWADAQNGFAILFTVRNQSGSAPWSVVEDVTFVNNVVRHTGGAINVLGRDDANPSEQTERLLIRNNLFEDIGGPRWGGDGRFLQITEAVDVTVDHNTVLQTGSLVYAYGEPSPGLVFTNNVAPHNAYGVIGDNVGSGLAALARYFPGYVFRRNVLAGGPSGLYPAGNFFPASLAPTEALAEQYWGAGTDGKDLGCDLGARKAVRGTGQISIPPQAQKR